GKHLGGEAAGGAIHQFPPGWRLGVWRNGPRQYYTPDAVERPRVQRLRGRPLRRTMGPGGLAMTQRKVKPVPTGYHSATPYLIVDGAASRLAFYKEALGAAGRMRMPGPGGKIGQAEVSIGDSVVMLADEHPEVGARGPRAYGCTPVSLHLYVPDVDTTVKKAVAA